MIRALLMWFGLALPAVVAAHPLAPALLQLRQSGTEDYEVLWRTAVSRVQGSEVAPQMPASCVETRAPEAQLEDGEAVVTRWAIHCNPPGLTGSRIEVRGLGNAGINVIFRLERSDGAVSESLLDANQTSLTVTPPDAAPPVFSSYVRMGISHLLTGYDHLLFVGGLLLLVRRLRTLLVTVTAFTIGHSITLALATLNLIHVNAALAEFGIALSILILANEVVRGDAQRSWLSRRPALMAGSFGLLHGLGFAGALAEVGLPPHEIPLALLAFNIGIELGQLLLIAALLTIAGGWRWLSARWPTGDLVLSRALPGYFIGTLAAYWCWERLPI